jgi:hypothetical protein
MADHETTLDIAALYEDGEALRDALMARDLGEARFRVRRMADIAGVLHLGTVEAAAITVIDALGPEGSDPSPGYVGTAFTLSDVLDEMSRKTPAIRTD